jgi:hypothetical protein
LRHSFAVNALLRWYRAGENVEAKFNTVHLKRMGTKGVNGLLEGSKVRCGRRRSGWGIRALAYRTIAA